jgi:hypothetical protein
MSLIAARADALLNKVIHRPVESVGNLKIIFGLPAILMFHFNFVALTPGLPWKALRAGLGQRFVR